MKTEIRKSAGDVVKSLLDGELYRVNSSDETAVEIVPVEENKGDEGKKCFVATSAEPVRVGCKVFDEFFYLYEKAPAKMPEDGEFLIRDGRLMRNGREVECGTLVPVEIKALIPGAVIMTVRSRQEGRLDLFHYSVEEDVFSKLAEAKYKLELVYRHKDVTGFIVTEKETITVPAEEGETSETVETVKQSVRYYRGENRLFSSDAGWTSIPIIGSWSPCYVHGGSDPAVHVQLFSTSDTVKVVKDDFGTEYYAYDPENSGKRTTVTKIELVYYDDESDPLVTINCLEFPGVIDRVLPCNDEEHNFVFVTKRPAGIVHSNFGHFYRCAVGEDVDSVVQMYPVPLSIKFIGSSDTTFTFGNKKYEVCRIRVIKTRDRGFVTTIEEVK